MPERIVAAAAISREVDGRLVEHHKGEVVDLTAEECEAHAAALVPPEFDSLDEYEAFKSNVYRSQHGDTTAAGELARARAGGIETLAETPGGGSDLDVEQYAAWLRDEQPTNEQVIEMAHGDPERARRILEAEELVTGQAARKGVSEGLNKIIEGS